MRQRFDAQYSLGTVPIDQVEIPTKTRFQLANLLESMQYIYTHHQWRQKIFRLLEEHIMQDKQSTGRQGMSLWEIFVLAQVRNCLNTSYDQLHFMANDSELLRGILGVLPSDFSAGKQYEYQNIYDNVSLLDEQLLSELNELIVEMGHQVFKKKEEVGLALKTDSFVVETDVHYPTDYNLLWDSARKCIEQARKMELSGWRKHADWKRVIKTYMRKLARTSKGGGAGRAKRVAKAAGTYLKKARALESKVDQAIATYGPDPSEEQSTEAWKDLRYYAKMLSTHIELVERRLIERETIPHDEKIFSIFQPWTELLKKGKSHPPCEFGKNLAPASDHYHLIVDWELADGRADSELIEDIAERLRQTYQIQSWSTDRGFSKTSIKKDLEAFIPEVIMPKKGRRTLAEKQAEARPAFRRLKKAHSAVESNINELEHRGLDRCPDRTLPGFKRYVGLAVTAYNLQKIGQALRQRRRQQARAA